MAVEVVKVSASWCGPCKMYAKSFHTVEEQFKTLNKPVSFREVSDEKDEEEFDKFSQLHEIRNVPTTIFFKDNVVVNRIVGNVPVERLKEEIEKIIEE